MRIPSRPNNEAERLEALASYDVLDTPPEAAFDALTKLAAEILKVPMALVSLVDDQRQWFKSRYGLDVPQTPRDISFCGHVVELDQALIVPDAHADQRFRDNPLVTGPPWIRFYAGCPLRTSQGHVLGTLCAIDRQPRQIEPQLLAVLEVLADQTMAQLDLRRANRLLQQEQNRLRAVLEAATSAIIHADAAGVIREVNPATTRLFGYAPHELVGRPLETIMPEPTAKEHGGLRHFLQAGERPAQGQVREVMARHKDGTLFPCELSLGEGRCGEERFFTGILHDISKRKRGEAKQAEMLADLGKSRDDLLRILNQLRLGTLAVDGAGRVTFASEFSCTSTRESLGRRWEEVLPFDEGARRQIRELLGKPEAERRRLEIELPHGAEKCAVELEIRDDPRYASGHIFYLYDVSEVRAMRKALAGQRRGGMIGESATMRELYATIAEIAKGEWTVLIEGETGTGKELVAQAIHNASPRCKGPFIAANCAGLTESILGSQLFGHVKGAFTGAVTDRAGLFEAAVGGTLFLDEIGDVTGPVQAALLRALQEKEITRLGETRPRKVDVRIIVATNRNLQDLVRDGKFREDLLYRLRGARVRVPPLYQRREDIGPLVAAFLAEDRVTAGKMVTEVSQAALRQLARYDWPGNVRELRGAIEYAVVRCRSSRIEMDDLPPEILDAAPTPPPVVDVASERDRIISALKRTAGNRARAARMLGIGRATLYRRLGELGITAEEAGDEELA